jgi:hypothetical protein
MWLWAAAVVGLAGVWALWRSRRRGRNVSSLKLWRDLTVAGGARRRRRIDPLWVLVLAAAVLAAGALAGPTWVVGERPTVGVQWAVRSVGAGGPTEAWVHVPQADDGMQLLVNGAVQRATGSALRRGMALAVASEGARVNLELQVRNEVLATGEFVRPAGAGREFGLVTHAVDGAIDAALERAFQVQPGVRVGDPSVRPVVLLINAPHVQDEELAGAALVVAEPRTALPGIHLGPRVAAPGDGWKPEVAAGAASGDEGISWPRFVNLQEVRVKAVRDAQLSAEWRVLARVAEHPWVAVREVPWKDGGKGVWVWLGSEPLAETNWPREAGFVVFYGEVSRQALGNSAGEAAAGEAVTWEQLPSKPVAAAREVGLQWALGVAGMGLLAGAVAWQVGRGR